MFLSISNLFVPQSDGQYDVKERDGNEEQYYPQHQNTILSGSFISRRSAPKSIREKTLTLKIKYKGRDKAKYRRSGDPEKTAEKK